MSLYYLNGKNSEIEYSVCKTNEWIIKKLLIFMK